MDYQKVIEEIFQTVNEVHISGEVANYIPELAKVDPTLFGIHLTTVDHRQFSVGDATHRFSIQSIAKVLSLTMIYRVHSGKIWSRVGVEPSGTPFNSLVQLEKDKGIPRNPFINSGAMVICDMLVTMLDNPKEEFLQFIRDITSNDTIAYSPIVAQSELSVGYRNIALCNFIKSFDNLENNPEEVLDFYFHMCSVEMNCAELSKVFLYLADDQFIDRNGNQILNMSQAKRMNAIMQTCGFYDESGEFSYKVGLPGKSGVGGGIIAILPDKYTIAVWSPMLNKKGNSEKGMRFLELFTTATESIF